MGWFDPANFAKWPVACGRYCPDRLYEELHAHARLVHLAFRLIHRVQLPRASCLLIPQRDLDGVFEAEVYDGMGKRTRSSNRANAGVRSIGRQRETERRETAGQETGSRETGRQKI